MFSLRRFKSPWILGALTGTVLTAPTPLLGQGRWVSPQDPCDVRPGHFLVNGAQQHLKLAVEATHEDQRESRLDRALDVLMRAITESGQADNPGAWYYLGRYYTEQRDPQGADSAFRKVIELAPQCTEDVQSYLHALYPEVRVAALQAWQDGAIDSATTLFHLGRTLAPDDAELPFYMAMMYSSQQELDSASKYLDLGIDLAAGDPDLDQRQRQTLLDVTGGYERIAFEDSAVSRVGQSRLARDTLRSAIVRDSTRLADLMHEWAGRNLRPEVQQAVQRDSTQIADRLSAATAVLAPAIEAHQRDSAAASAAFANTLRGYERFLELYPSDGENISRLLRRYSMLGQGAKLDPLIDRITALDGVEVNELMQLGSSLFNDGFPARAVSILEVAAQRNPYLQSTRYLLTRIHYALGDGEQLRENAARLLEIDPMNPVSVRMMAAAWDLLGESDSVLAYVALADSGLGWGVTVTQFLPTARVAVANGSIANITPHPLDATSLVFEFLDADGTLLASVTADVPALAARQRHAFTVRAEVGGAVAWRYRRR